MAVAASHATRRTAAPPGTVGSPAQQRQCCAVGRGHVSAVRSNAGVLETPALILLRCRTTPPAVTRQRSADDGYFGIIACLSCHDGNLAKVGMMKGTTVETVTIAGASFNPPTLLGNDGSTPGNYLNDHPVGPTANPGCGGPYNWDCTVNADGSISFTGPNSTQFIADYYDVTSGNGPLAQPR